MNYAVMNGLQPGVRYFYIYGDAKLGKSKERTFVMGPDAAANATVSVLVTADMVLLHPFTSDVHHITAVMPGASDAPAQCFTAADAQLCSCLTSTNTSQPPGLHVLPLHRLEREQAFYSFVS